MSANEARRDEFETFSDEAEFDLTDPSLFADSLEDLLDLELDSPHATQGPRLASTEQRADGEKGEDRRKNVVGESPTGLERRRGPGRRLTDFVKAAEEGEMNSEQFLFLKAIETFKTVNNKHYPNWTDVLEVIRLLGYRKVQASELNLPAADDWLEKADTASNVREREGVTHKRRKSA